MSDKDKVLTPADLLKDKDKDINISSFINDKFKAREFQVVPVIRRDINIKTPY